MNKPCIDFSPKVKLLVVKFFLARVMQSLLVLWLVGTMAFVALHFTGDPVALLSAEDATPQEREILRRAYGLEQPMAVQYLIFFGNTLKGNLGNSFYSPRPAMQLLLERLPATLLLVLLGLTLAMIIGIPIGILSAAQYGSSLDQILQTLTSLILSAPTFWIGILLIQIFAVNWQLLPSQGNSTALHLILPALTLALPRAAVYIRILRLQLLEVLTEDFIRTARAKGVLEPQILYQHALRNALIPFVTVLGMQLAGLLSGAVIVESLFAYPGMNRVALDAMNRLDIPVILAFVLLSAFVYAMVNLLTDLTYLLIDPRVRYE
jgi:peptide/nickel transport system permease protein